MSNKTRGKFSKKSAYLIGLSTVILLTLFNQFLIQRILSEQKYDAMVINLAGRQRMLSQKITKDALLTVQQASSLDLLKTSTLYWGKINEGLQNGNSDLGLPELESETVQILFDRLDPFQEAVTQAILSAGSAEELAQNLPVILSNEQQFLSIMDEIVNTLEQESSERIRRLIYLEMFLAFFSIVVLAGEFVFIFKPIYGELEEENDELEKTIKELTHSKGELFKATQRFDLSIEAINAGIWDWYIPDGTEWWSDKFHSLLGYKKSEINASYNTFLYELLHPDDRKKVEKAVKAHLEERESYKLEIRMKTKDGYYRWFETVGQASWDYKGEPIRMVGSIIDIEEKKQFEAQLSKDEDTLRIQRDELEKALKDLSEIQEVAKIGTWEVDLKTMNAYWSDEVYRIHEVPNGIEIKVEDGINYYREDYRPIIQGVIDKAIENNESWDVECVLVTALGNEVWVRAIGFPIFENDELVALRGLFMNIDESKKASIDIEIQKDALLEVSTKLSLAVNTGQIGVWAWEIGTSGLDWDDQMLKIYGITREQFTNGYDSYAEAVLPEDLPRIEEELQRAVSTKSRFDTEFRIKTPDGDIKYIIAKADIMLAADGEPVKMIGINYDISEVKSAERTLTEAQEIGKIGNWAWDMEEDKITWSDQNYKIFGQDKSFNPTFESLNQLTHPDDRELFQKDVEDAITENRPHDFVHRIVLENGTKIKYIHERGKVYYNNEGKPYRMAGTSQDVTEQCLKELELNEKTEQLELSKKQLQTFISNAPVAVAMVDDTMNYIAASNKWYKDYGLKQKNIVGQNHYDIFPEIKKNEQWLDDHKRALKGEELSSDRDKFVRGDGSVQWLSWKILPWYDEPGEIGGLIMYTADITNEVKYQDQLKNLNEILEHQVQLRTEELNNANKELESFSYSVSHDLRAPLRAINGFADILEEDYSNSLDEEGRRLVDIIKSSGVKMGQLIDDILAFSRLGRKELKKENVNLNKMFQDVIRDISLDFNKSDIDVDIKNLPEVQGDSALLMQVVTNLVSNAVKYSSKEKKIKIGVNGTKKTNNHIIEVKDNGAGFDMKYHDKMFGVFQRLHTSEEFEGTGVGLAIVKRIINKHGGEIWAESEPGKGASFYFSLPIS